jgi:hypothetical protein
MARASFANRRSASLQTAFASETGNWQASTFVMIEKESSCCVCFDDHALQLDVCEHFICDICLERWMRESATCPMCRCPIVGTRQREKPHILLHSHAHMKEKIGIFIKTTRYGVLVTQVDTDLMPSVVRKGGILSHVNGIHVSHAVAAQRIIQNARVSRMDVELRFANAMDSLSFPLFDREKATIHKPI